MDSGTHLVFGLGLAGLAHVDPVVSGDSLVAAAVLIGTVIGSQAPDFDTLFRLKGNAAYIKNHRGITHSLPFIALWTGMITCCLTLAFGNLPFWHLLAWVFLAVALHVFTDLFNTYGTQALRPFSHKWISWNIIHIFDPFIFGAHVLAILLWSLKILAPSAIFSTLYSILAVYYIWRTVQHHQIAAKLPKLDPDYREGEQYMLITTINLYAWNVLKKRANGEFVIGEWRAGKLQWIDRLACARHPAVEASRKHPDIAAFLYFTSFACADVREHKWGYEVRWADVRYHHRKQYPFVGVLLLDYQLRPLDSYVGWLSDTRLEKKLRFDLSS
ncbi:MAG TPA: metal-dependent hydrolase [Bacilli bacterium]